MESSTQTSVFQIINTSSKGLWPPSENVTLVQASSREAIIRAIFRGQDTFVEKRLTPCHQYLSCLIKNFRGDPADSDEEFEPDPDALIKTMTEDEAVKKILQEIDGNSVNDGGFYTAIQKLECVEAAGQGVHQLNTSCD